MPEVIEDPLRKAPARLADVVDYRGPSDLGEGLHGEVAEGLRAMAEALAAEEPPGVEAVVAWTPVSWQKLPAEVQMITVASAERNRWDTLTPLAEIIGPVLPRLSFMPMHEPITWEGWGQSAEREGRTWRHVTRRGILLYSAE